MTTPSHGRRGDRRVEKTHHSLRQALHSLIAEKPYEAIVVKEILHRANVGRSTFYSHFRDKDALLVDGIRDLIHAGPLAGTTPPPERLLWFSRPIFEHLSRHRSAARRITPRDQAALHARLQQVLAGAVADALRVDRQRRRAGPPLEVIGQYVASSFMVALHWWLERDATSSAAEADATFRALVVPTLETL